MASFKTVSSDYTITANVGLGNITHVGNTFVGNLVASGNVFIGGNLDIVGNITQYDIQTLNIADPIITLAANNATNVVDIGFVGQFAPAGTVEYGGLIRNHVTNEWDLFSNIYTKPTTTVNFTNARYDTLNAGNINLTGNANITANLNVANFVTSNLMPVNDLIQIVGNATNQWRELFVGNITAGNLSLSGNLNTSNISVANIADIRILQVTETATISGNINGGGNLNLAGNAVVIGNIDGSSSLNIAGLADIAGNINGGGNLNLAGNAVVLGNVDVTGNVNANNATIATNVVVGNTMTSKSVRTDSLNWANGTPIISNTGNINVNNIRASGFANIAGETNALSFVSTVSTGTPPLVVASSTLVANLNANLLNGVSNTSSNTVNTIVSRDLNSNFSANTITVRQFIGDTSTIGTLVTAGNVISTNDQDITLDPKSDSSSLGTVFIMGNLQVSGNVTTVNSTTVTTNSLLYQAANNAINATAASGGGLAVGPTGGSYATWTFNSISNSWVSNLNTVAPSSQITSLGVGTAASGTAGEIRATNNITGFYASDRQFKENVQPIENALDKVEAIGGKTFDWTDSYIEQHGGEDGYFVTKADAGVIAQDVQAVFPQAVRTREDGSLAVDYAKLSSLAFAAIVELRREVENLKALNSNTK